MLFWRSGPRFECDAEFQIRGCHYADEPIYVGPSVTIGCLLTHISVKFNIDQC